MGRAWGATVHCVTQTVWQCAVYRIYHVHWLKSTLLIKDAMACGRLSQFNCRCLLPSWLIVSRCSTVNTAPLALLYCLHLANLASLCSGDSADLSDLSRSLLCLSCSSLSIYKELTARWLNSLSVNHAGYFLCDEHTYQPYMELQ